MVLDMQKSLYHGCWCSESFRSLLINIRRFALLSMVVSWWRHQMEILSALLAFCTQKPVTQNFDLWSELEQTVEWTIETLVIWNAIIASLYCSSSYIIEVYDSLIPSEETLNCTGKLNDKTQRTNYIQVTETNNRTTKIFAYFMERVAVPWPDTLDDFTPTGVMSYQLGSYLMVSWRVIVW